MHKRAQNLASRAAERGAHNAPASRRPVDAMVNGWRVLWQVYNCPLLSCPTIALPEPVLGQAYGLIRGPTNATSVGLLWVISSGAISSWTTRTSLW
jgi:hypothetical protein